MSKDKALDQYNALLLSVSPEFPVVGRPPANELVNGGRVEVDIHIHLGVGNQGILEAGVAAGSEGDRPHEVVAALPGG